MDQAEGKAKEAMSEAGERARGIQDSLRDKRDRTWHCPASPPRGRRVKQDRPRRLGVVGPPPVTVGVDRWPMFPKPGHPLRWMPPKSPGRYNGSTGTCQ
ncbi:hypothetical protein ACFY04_12405 [Streptomyces sp. NPDC001549]|uniref:hypothetical protein n=1 Tax=Streptomyces sp. NPDC001549 TaxID=3364586 RepID=UPI0036CAB203